MSLLLGPPAISEEGADAQWDGFLSASAKGHFQQTSAWARAKRAEGWNCRRAVWRHGGVVVGGYQLLWRRSRAGAIGYVYKGPVVGSSFTDQYPLLLASLARTNRDMRAIIVQLPDAEPEAVLAGAPPSFLPNHLVRVIDATLLVDLRGGIEQLGPRIRKTTWHAIRQAQRLGVLVREGERRDLPTFFRLMLATCKRQHTSPQPSTLEALTAVWDALAPGGGIKMHLAECDGQTVAAALALAFAKRVTLWKKGWDGQFSERHPNSLVTFEALRWAAASGYEVLDFAAVNPALADTLLAGRPVTEQQRKLRDIFLLGFGAAPVRFAPSRLVIPNPVFRGVYRAISAWPAGRRLMRKAGG